MSQFLYNKTPIAIKAVTAAITNPTGPVMAVIAAAEELDYPVIIQHAPLHEQYVPVETITLFA